jgi:hypothetical protein
MPDTVAGTFPTRAAADEAIAALRSAGFENQRVRLVPPGRVRLGTEPLKLTRRSVWGSVVGSLIGGIAGAIIAWICVLIVPPLNDFQAAAIIVGALTGGTIGWVLGAIAGTRAPVEEGEYRREAAEHGVGPTVVTVEARERVDEAGRILMRYGATLRPAGEMEDSRYETGSDPSPNALA